MFFISSSDIELFCGFYSCSFGGNPFIICKHELCFLVPTKFVYDCEFLFLILLVLQFDLGDEDCLLTCFFMPKFIRSFDDQ